MTDDMAQLKRVADLARDLYRLARITRAEAHTRITPYLTAANRRGREIAAKYGRRHRPLTFASYVR